MSQVFIASDHGGFSLKQGILQSGKFDLIDLGCFSNDPVDYPDIADTMAEHLRISSHGRGILICGTGIGISIRANRHLHIRAALVHSAFTAEMSKAHNDANVICLGGRILSVADAIHFVSVWQDTPFEGGRHATRVAKLDKPIG